MSQPVYRSTPVVPLSRAPHAVPDALDPSEASVLQPLIAEPFPAQALHACRVLAHVLQRVPRPESIQLFTAEHWSSPWLQVHLYPDPDDAQLAAYQHVLGGRLTRNRHDGESRTIVYSELATVVDRVRIQVWNVNESPLPTPLASVPSPGQTPPPAEPGPTPYPSSLVADTAGPIEPPPSWPAAPPPVEPVAAPAAAPVTEPAAEAAADSAEAASDRVSDPAEPPVADDTVTEAPAEAAAASTDADAAPGTDADTEAEAGSDTADAS